jgi:hypothetical protein
VHAQDACTIVRSERPASAGTAAAASRRPIRSCGYDDLPVDQADLANVTVYLFGAEP